MLWHTVGTVISRGVVLETDYGRFRVHRIAGFQSHQMYPLDSNTVPPPFAGAPELPMTVPPPLPPSPAEEARLIEAHAGQFYVIDSSRVTMRESANVTKSPFVLLIVFVMKLFRIPIPSSMDDPNVESLRPFEVTEASLPPEEQAALQPMLAELGALGFGAPIFHALWDPYHST